MRVLKLVSLSLALLLCGFGALAQTEAEANDRTRVDKDPIPINLEEVRARIGYPELAVATRSQGRVMMRVLVDQSGNCLKHQILQDPGSLLSRAVDDQITLLKFKPAIFDGHPIKCWVKIPFEFQLHPSAGSPFATDGVFFCLDSALRHPDRATHLVLNDQQMAVFPSEVLRLPYLRVLDLCGNALTEIPEEIQGLPRLMYLGLADNRVTELPKAIFAMPMLEEVNLRGNPIAPRTQKRIAQSIAMQTKAAQKLRVIW